MKLQISTIRALKDNFIYAIHDSMGNCAIVDPGEVRPVLEFLNQQHLRLTHILCTHHHWDHVDGVEALVERFQVPVWASAVDQARVPKASMALREGQVTTLLGEELRALEVPGHTQGQLVLWLPGVSAAFVGDTLFSCGCGRLIEGTPQQMFASLAKICTLPPETLIYFGHEYTLRNIDFVRAQGGENEDLREYEERCKERLARGEPTTPVALREELLVNPFLRARTLEEFRRWREARDTW